MDRIIKFRAWSTKGNFMEDVAAEDLQSEEYRLFVPDAILLQFTGLTDKNGKEIYEGDVVEYLSRCGAVEWDESGQFAVRFPKDSGFNWRLGSFNTKDMEVIGNIYENSDLLK